MRKCLVTCLLFWSLVAMGQSELRQLRKECQKRNVAIRSLKYKRDWTRLWLKSDTIIAGASGVILSDGRVLTAFHAIRGMGEYYVNGKAAKVIRSWPERDLVLLETEIGKGMPPIELAPELTNDEILVMGNPDNFPNKASIGEIIGTGEASYSKPYKGKIFTSDALIFPGSSGGGAYDLSGRLVGMVVGYYDGGRTSVFVPISDIKKFLTDPVYAVK